MYYFWRLYMLGKYVVAKETKKKNHVVRNFIILILAVFVYLFADSNLGFIRVNKYNVMYDNLPDSFDGFRIMMK